MSIYKHGLATERGGAQERNVRRGARNAGAAVAWPGRSRRRGAREPVAEYVDLGEDLCLYGEGGGEEWPGSIDDVPGSFQLSSSGGAADAVTVEYPALVAIDGDREGNAGDGDDANREVPARGVEEALKDAASAGHWEGDGGGE